MNSNFIIDEVLARAFPGAEISECVREVIVLAMTEQRRVVLTHNDREYLIDPKMLLMTILKQHETSN
jgi:hypothetical protein